MNTTKKIEELISMQEAAANKLTELKEAGDDAWEDLKAGIDSAWDSLGSALKRLLRDSSRHMLFTRLYVPFL